MFRNLLIEFIIKVSNDFTTNVIKIRDKKKNNYFLFFKHFKFIEFNYKIYAYYYNKYYIFF